MFRQIVRLTTTTTTATTAKGRPAFNFRGFGAVGSSRTHKVLVLAEYKSSSLQPLVKPTSLDICWRGFAKNRDRKKEKTKRVRYDENELREYFDVDKLLEEIRRPLEAFREELIRHTSVRTNPGTVESVKLHFDGEEYTIQDLAEVGKKSPRLYILDFSSFPSAIPAALRALQNSELNLNVQQEGNNLIVPVPRVNKEQRELLARKSKLYFVKCKDGIREVQLKYIKRLGQIEKLPSQEKFRLTEQLTALGDQQIEIAKELLKGKQDDLMDDEE